MFNFQEEDFTPNGIKNFWIYSFPNLSMIFISIFLAFL